MATAALGQLNGNRVKGESCDPSQLSQLSPQLPVPFLLAMDFDNTVVEHDRGRKIQVQSLFPEGKLPEELLQHLDEHGWDSFSRATYR